MEGVDQRAGGEVIEEIISIDCTWLDYYRWDWIPLFTIPLWRGWSGETIYYHILIEIHGAINIYNSEKGGQSWCWPHLLVFGLRIADYEQGLAGIYWKMAFQKIFYKKVWMVKLWGPPTNIVFGAQKSILSFEFVVYFYI